MDDQLQRMIISIPKIEPTQGLQAAQQMGTEIPGLAQLLTQIIEGTTPQLVKVLRVELGAILKTDHLTRLPDPIPDLIQEIRPDLLLTLAKEIPEAAILAQEVILQALIVVAINEDKVQVLTNRILITLQHKEDRAQILEVETTQVGKVRIKEAQAQIKATRLQEQEEAVLPQILETAELQVPAEAQDPAQEARVLEAAALALEVVLEAVLVQEGAQAQEVVHEVQEDKNIQNNLHYEKNTNTPNFRSCIELLCPNH